jgi:hypothetical protein
LKEKFKAQIAFFDSQSHASPLRKLGALAAWLEEFSVSQLVDGYIGFTEPNLLFFSEQSVGFVFQSGAFAPHEAFPLGSASRLELPTSAGQLEDAAEDLRRILSKFPPR